MRRSTRRLLSATVLVLAVLGALLAGAVVTGRVTFGGTHGVSMNPVYYQGDLVLVARADSYRVGDIVAYRVPAQHMIILHRIIGEADGGFVMNGDNNESIDPTHPTPSLVIGRATPSDTATPRCWSRYTPCQRPRVVRSSTSPRWPRSPNSPNGTEC